MKRLAVAGALALAACGTTPDATTVVITSPANDTNARPVARWQGDEYQPPPSTTTTARASRSRTTTTRGPRLYGVRLLACIRNIESTNNYAAVSRSGKYRGAYQFDQSTWRGAVTRAGYPEYANTPPNEAPPAVQDAAAAQLLSERGLQPWPTPSRRCA